MSNKPRGVNRALEQGTDALGVLADMFMPGLREKFASREESDGPRESDVVAAAEDACATCEGAGDLVNVRGRHVTCAACGGRGTRCP